MKFTSYMKLNKAIVWAAYRLGFDCCRVDFRKKEFHELRKACCGHKWLAEAALEQQYLKHYSRISAHREEWRDKGTSVGRWEFFRKDFGGKGAYAKRLFKHPRTGEWWLCHPYYKFRDYNASTMSVSDRMAECINRYLDAYRGE